MRGGKTQVVDVPEPGPAPGFVLVANAASAISSGTERSVVASGSGSLAARAIKNPQLVAQTLRHAREHGVRETIGLVKGAVAEDSLLGYSTAGTVIDTGGVPGLHVGQRVAAAGAGQANHAEIVSVPANLVAAVPEGVSLRDASFGAIGAIAIQGVRRAAPTLGERVVVVGLGLLGLITVQALRAAGCRVAGVEPVEGRRSLGKELGAELVLEPAEAVDAISAWTDGVGADAVIVTASSKSDDLVNDAVRMLRRKGRVVPVGDVGLGLSREALYEREADVLISTSYGPGRYDASYEEAGVDYPLPYARWTAGRNIEEFLRLLSEGLVTVDPLIQVEVPVERAVEAYEALAGSSPPLAAALTYAERSASERSIPRSSGPVSGRNGSEIRIALVGAGAFVRSMHLPNLQAEDGVSITTVVSRGGSSAASLARSLNGARPGTDWREAVDATGRRPRRRCDAARLARGDLGGGAPGGQGRLRREAARPDARADRRRLGRRRPERPPRDRLQPAVLRARAPPRAGGGLADRPVSARVPRQLAGGARSLAERPARGRRPHPRRGLPHVRLRQLAAGHARARHRGGGAGTRRRWLAGERLGDDPVR